MAWDGNNTYGVSGAFYPASNSTDALVTNMNGARSRREYFSASRVVPTTTENRPYTIYALPLIAY